MIMCMLDGVCKLISLVGKQTNVYLNKSVFCTIFSSLLKLCVTRSIFDLPESEAVTRSWFPKETQRAIKCSSCDNYRQLAFLLS